MVISIQEIASVGWAAMASKIIENDWQFAEALLGI